MIRGMKISSIFTMITIQIMATAIQLAKDVYIEHSKRFGLWLRKLIIWLSVLVVKSLTTSTRSTYESATLECLTGEISKQII